MNGGIPPVRPMNLDHTPFLVRLLVERGQLGVDEIDALALSDATGPDEVEERLLKSGRVDERGLARAASEVLGRPWFEFEETLGAVVVCEHAPGGGSADWGELSTLLGAVRDRAGLDAAWCAARAVQPLAERDGTLHLLAADAGEPSLGEEARALTGKAVVVHPATRGLRQRIAAALAAGVAEPADAGPLADLASLADEETVGSRARTEARADAAADAAAGTSSSAAGTAGSPGAGFGDGLTAGLGSGLEDGLTSGLGAADTGDGLAGGFGAADTGDDLAGGFGAADTGDAPAQDYDPDVDVDLSRPLPPGPEAQVLRLVNHILAQAVELGASDLHLEPYEKDTRIRLRVDGKLSEFEQPPRHLFPQMISRLKILAKMDIAEKRVPQDGGITMKAGKSRVDLRASTVPTCYGEKMVLRVLDKDGIPDNMEFLGLSDRQAKDFIEAAQAHHGLMFVTGPTGSGKSTTLYCALNLTNTPDKNIVTVEDPVEFKFHGLNQVPIRASAGMTFAGALRAFLRQDPDVIMVGEVRDTETAQICMRAALTGHLVLSTLHTNSALQVVTRLTDMGIEPFLLGPALRLIEAQRLVRRLCTECKTPYELPADVAARHRMEAGELLYAPAQEPDCPKCKGMGYKGRVGIYEVVPVDDAMQDMIARGTSEREMEAFVRERGIDLIPDSSRAKLREGITSLQEVSDYIRRGGSD